MKMPTDLRLHVKLLRYVESLSLGPKAPEQGSKGPWVRIVGTLSSMEPFYLLR